MDFRMHGATIKKYVFLFIPNFEQHLKTYLFAFFSKTSLLNVKLVLQDVCTFLGSVRRPEKKPLFQENAERKYFQPKYPDMENIEIGHLHTQTSFLQPHL
jgi:hypothetical protein